MSTARAGFRGVGVGRCSECKRRREVGRAQRFAGGSYKCPGRYYWTSVCEECATDALDYADSVILDGRSPGVQSGGGLTYSALRHLLDRPAPTPTTQQEGTLQP